MSVVCSSSLSFVVCRLSAIIYRLSSSSSFASISNIGTNTSTFLLHSIAIPIVPMTTDDNTVIATIINVSMFHFHQPCFSEDLRCFFKLCYFRCFDAPYLNGLPILDKEKQPLLFAVIVVKSSLRIGMRMPMPLAISVSRYMLLFSVVSNGKVWELRIPFSMRFTERPNNGNRLLSTLFSTHSDTLQRKSFGQRKCTKMYIPFFLFFSTLSAFRFFFYSVRYQQTSFSPVRPL